MPWTMPEAVADEKGSNGDGDGESDKSSNSGNAEDGADCDDTAKHQQCQTNANDGVKPHSVDRSLRMFVDPLPDAREREAVVTGVSVRDSTGSHHAALTHAEAADNRQAEDGEGRLLRHDLQEICGPRLTKTGAN